MQYERPAVESRESVEAELLRFLNNNEAMAAATAR